MNHCVPEWSMEEDSRSIHGLPPSANHLKPIWPDDELVELLWQNGHVVMHSQTHRKTTTSPSEMKPCQKPESAVKGGLFKSSANMVHGETAPWLQYPIDDSLEREFCPELFYELPTTESPAVGKLKDIVAKGDKSRKHETAEENGMFAESVFEQSNIPQFAANVMPYQSEFVASLPQTTLADCGGDRNFPHFSRKAKGISAPLNGYVREKKLGNQIKGEAGESSSMMTKESRICASNQVHNWFAPSYTNNEDIALEKSLTEDAPTRLSHEKAQTDVHETTITSSSGGSGCTIGRTGQQSANNRINKRKGRDADESELQSEEADYESMETSRQPQRSASARRRRVADVHNLSERRRRDRINEKMRALQELIPHCNKSDKASMLDEAIEYLKSLQLQVQIMWMRSGLAPMMFLGVHHYMPQMGMGMGHSSMPPIHGPIPFPRVPLVNQPVPSNPTVNQASFCPLDISPLSFQNQMQNAHIPTSYARYLGFQHMQPSPQMMNLFAYGAQLMQQNQAAALAANKCAPCTGDAPSENAQDGSTG